MRPIHCFPLTSLELFHLIDVYSLVDEQIYMNNKYIYPLLLNSLNTGHFPFQNTCFYLVSSYALTRKYEVVNQVKFLGLVHHLATV